MRQFIGGDGSDTTTAVKTYLGTHNNLFLADLILIGEIEDPTAILLTTWASPLDWPVWGIFKPAVIKRDGISSKVGLEVTSISLTWSPPVTDFTQSIATANPYQLVQFGFFDNKRVRIWRTLMPTEGDSNTFGACEWFGGWISDSTVERGKIVFTVDSFLNVINQKVPQNLIELNSTIAAYRAATPPPGLTVVPQFNVIAGSTPIVLIGDSTFPNTHQIFGAKVFQLGYVVFQGGTLDGQWSAIANSGEIKVPPVTGTNYNSITLYSPLPWAPTPGVDKFYVSAAFPINRDDGAPDSFPFVPAAEGAL